MAEINMMMTIDSANADEAYERVLPEAMALAPETLPPINLDTVSVLITAMGVSEKLPAFMEELKRLSADLAKQLEKFPDYILALFSAQSRYTFAITPPEQLPIMLARATKLRDILIADAKALVLRDLLDGELLDELTGIHGYKNVAFDLAGLTRIFKSDWANLSAKTGLIKAELDEADRLALRLAAAVAHREHATESVAAATEIRRRMFALVYWRYDKLRCAMSYLRWEQDDVDEIVPSLYAGRPNSNIVKRKRAGSGDTATTAGSAVAAEAPAGTAAHQGAADVGILTNNTDATAAASKSPAQVPVGYPGSDPFR